MAESSASLQFTKKIQDLSDNQKVGNNHSNTIIYGKDMKSLLPGNHLTTKIVNTLIEIIIMENGNDSRANIFIQESLVGPALKDPLQSRIDEAVAKNELNSIFTTLKLESDTRFVMLIANTETLTVSILDFTQGSGTLYHDDQYEMDLVGRIETFQAALAIILHNIEWKESEEWEYLDNHFFIPNILIEAYFDSGILMLLYVEQLLGQKYQDTIIANRIRYIEMLQNFMDIQKATVPLPENNAESSNSCKDSSQEPQSHKHSGNHQNRKPEDNWGQLTFRATIPRIQLRYKDAKSLEFPNELTKRLIDCKLILEMEAAEIEDDRTGYVYITTSCVEHIIKKEGDIDLNCGTGKEIADVIKKLKHKKSVVFPVHCDRSLPLSHQQSEMKQGISQKTGATCSSKVQKLKPNHWILVIAVYPLKSFHVYDPEKTYLDRIELGSLKYSTIKNNRVVILQSIKTAVEKTLQEKWPNTPGGNNWPISLNYYDMGSEVPRLDVHDSCHSAILCCIFMEVWSLKEDWDKECLDNFCSKALITHKSGSIEIRNRFFDQIIQAMGRGIQDKGIRLHHPPTSKCDKCSFECLDEDELKRHQRYSHRKKTDA